MGEDGRDSRKAILEAAREGFATTGFYGTSMDYITRNAGVSKGAVYWYFPGKWEVYKTVVSDEAERLKRIVLPPGVELTRGEALDFFLTRGEQLIGLFADDTICRLLFVYLQLEAMRGRDEMAEFLTSLRESITEDVISVMQTAYPEGAFSVLGISQREFVNMFMSVLGGIVLNIGLTITRQQRPEAGGCLSLQFLGVLGMRRRKLVIFLLLPALFLAASSARAAEPLSLEKALALAGKNNPVLAAGRQRIIQAREKIDQAAAPGLPQLGVSLLYQESDKDPFHPVFIGGQKAGYAQAGFRTTWKAALTVSQLIYSGGAVKYSTESGKMALRGGGG